MRTRKPWRLAPLYVISLDAGDEALQILMTQLEQAIDIHFGKRPFDKKKPEPVKVEAMRANGT